MFFICAFIYNGHAQLGFCSGNSGDPIFVEDFGTGTTNSQLPPGTTTYNYINGFPNDGFYTVDNGSFGNPFDWHETLDHTPGDVNGKFLMVNASFTAGEFYRTSISGLCETTTYEFSAWIINLVEAGGFCSTQPGGTIPINVSFEIWDSTDTSILANGSTGDVFDTNSPNWQQYALVFQTLTGQNEVILKMINNGQGGCGNDLAIDDIEFKTCGDAITIADSDSNTNVDLCLNGTTFSTTLTVTPDNSVFSNHFYQWQQSTDGIVWIDIPGETTENLVVSNATTTAYFRAKVAESASNLNNTDCITFSDIYEMILAEAPSPPVIECWEIATLNNITCSWEVTGTQPEQPTDLECWETATFNNTTCAWEVTGTEPEQPTNLECWETIMFNETTCSWDISGNQPEEPVAECWETTTFNTSTCEWEITGTQPDEPTGLACWETTTFNDTSCSWEINGTQPEAPTIECWESTTFNDTTCSWEITGTQPEEPANLECWESTSFNNTTCEWEVIGTQPEEPTDLECWQSTSFDETLCAWEISGTEPLDTIDETVFFCDGEEATISGNISIDDPMYEWSTGEMTEEITVDEPGIYSVEITNNLCFTTIKTITVIENESPIIASVSSNGNDIIITTENSGDFEYSLDGIQYQSSNIFENIEGNLYTIYARDINGCGETTVEHLHFVIPLFFTPNSDGFNDTFDLKGIQYFSRSEVFIFNRYGKLLKSAKNQEFKWDGTFNNQQLPTADYWYLIKIDNQIFQGHFTLKR